MAKIKLGSLAQDARGSVAGVKFSRNRYGSVAMQKVSPVQPRTIRQLDQRSVFTLVSQAWRNLTAAQMAAWASWASTNPITDVFGDSQVLAGNAAYSKINATRLTLTMATLATHPWALAQSATPPPSPPSPDAAAISVTAVASSQTVTVTTAAQTGGIGGYAIWCTGGRSPGISFVNSDYRLVGSTLGFAAATSIAVVTTTYNPAVGFVAGQKVSVLVVRYSAQGVLIDSTRFDVIAT
jgi:hypothetical protein